MIVSRPRNNQKAFRPYYPRVVEVPYVSTPFAFIAYGDEGAICPGYPMDRRFVGTLPINPIVEVEVVFDAKMYNYAAPCQGFIVSSGETELFEVGGFFDPVDVVCNYNDAILEAFDIEKEIKVRALDDTLDIFSDRWGGFVFEIQLLNELDSVIQTLEADDVFKDSKSAFRFTVPNQTRTIRITLRNYVFGPDNAEDFEDKNTFADVVKNRAVSFSNFSVEDFESYAVGDTDTLGWASFYTTRSDEQLTPRTSSSGGFAADDFEDYDVGSISGATMNQQLLSLGGETNTPTFDTYA